MSEGGGNPARGIAVLIGGSSETADSLRGFVAAAALDLKQVSADPDAKPPVFPPNCRLVFLGDDGGEPPVAERLKALKSYRPGLPVIIVAAAPVLGEAVALLKQGADDYLGEPLVESRVAASLTKALAQRETRRIVIQAEARGFPRIPGYRLERMLGQGAVGCVFLASREDDVSRARFAVKTLRPATHSESYQLRLRRFLREAEAVAALRHPNVVQIVGHGTTNEGVPYLVMEYLEGKNLRVYLDQHRRLTYDRTADVMGQVASGLTAIHSEGIVHRDLKPENIMLSDKWYVRLTDFGVAHLPDSELTQTLSVVGSPAYLSPEAFVAMSLDHRADLFSLGVMGYEAAVGRRPFDAHNMAELARSIPHEAPPDPAALDPTFPAPLRAILACLLRKDPAQRYQTAAALSADLSGFRAGGAVQAATVEGDWR